MDVLVLGSAAGGGLPQWNCGCPVCRAAREGGATPRSQSSIAVRADGGPWYLVNASPDVRQQLELLRDGEVPLRSSPVAGVLLTDAEVDHTAGLVVLREGPGAVRIHASSAIRRALEEGFALLPVLAAYCGVDWRSFEPGETVELEGGLVCEAFAVPGDPPLYLGGGEPFGVGLEFRAGGARAVYVPAVREIGPDLRTRLEGADAALVDGTCWSDDELVALGVAHKRARDMGHAPLSGPGGTLPVLGGLAGTDVVLVHVNNTNPILIDTSPERAAVEAAGIRVAHDGLRLALEEGPRNADSTG